jgi:hypothetical protein
LRPLEPGTGVSRTRLTPVGTRRGPSRTRFLPSSRNPAAAIGQTELLTASMGREIRRRPVVSSTLPSRATSSCNSAQRDLASDDSGGEPHPLDYPCVTTFLKGALKGGEVRVDASPDGSRRERPEHACHTGQLDAGLEVNDRAGAFRGESVVVKKRGRSRGRLDDKLGRTLAEQDLEVVLDLTGW